MNRLTWCTSLAVALAGCADSGPEEPVDGQTAAEPPGYDMAPALDSPTQPSPALDGSKRTWTFGAADRTATYGPPGSEGTISLRCEENTLGNRRLVFDWRLAAPEDQNQTVTMRWGVDSERIAVEPVDGRWRAILEPTGEEANFLLAATSPITFTFGALGEPKVTAPASDRLKGMIQACQ